MAGYVDGPSMSMSFLFLLCCYLSEVPWEKYGILHHLSPTLQSNIIEALQNIGGTHQHFPNHPHSPQVICNPQKKEGKEICGPRYRYHC
jgi:hypothetical protein